MCYLDNGPQGQNIEINNVHYSLWENSNRISRIELINNNMVLSFYNISNEIIQIFKHNNNGLLNNTILDLFLSRNEIKQKLGVNLYNLQKHNI